LPLFDVPPLPVPGLPPEPLGTEVPLPPPQPDEAVIIEIDIAKVPTKSAFVVRRVPIRAKRARVM